MLLDTHVVSQPKPDSATLFVVKTWHVATNVLRAAGTAITEEGIEIVNKLVISNYPVDIGAKQRATSKDNAHHANRLPILLAATKMSNATVMKVQRLA